MQTRSGTKHLPTSWIFSLDLFSLRKAYGDNKAANSGFDIAAHIRDHSSACSVITANTKSDFTRDLYIESLEESLAAAQEHCATDATTRSPVPPVFNPLTLLQTELTEQRKQVSEVMAQNAKLMAALSKGGSGGDGGGGGGGRGKGGSGNNGGQHKIPWKEKKTLPKLQEGGCQRSCEVFLPQREQGQTPQGMGHQRWGMTGTGVPG